MSFFPNTDSSKEKNEVDNQNKSDKPGKIDPRSIIIDGDNLIKLIADNNEIKPGKTDRGIFQIDMWMPINYNPETGEMT